MAAYDHAGTLFALGLRLTKLSATGAPLSGPQNCYVTDSLITIGAGLSYTSNKQVTQENGRGAVCVSYQAPDTLITGVIDPLHVCVPDPNVLAFLMGGVTVLTPSEVQSLAEAGPPTAGTFTLTWSGQTTSAIAYNATAATVQAALIALSNIGTGNVICTGGPLPATPVTVTFAGVFAGISEVLITTTSTGLTGGTAAVTRTTAGGTGNAIGWRAPLVNTVALPNGVAVEAWANAIVDNTIPAVLPYWHYIWPKVRFTMSKALTLDATNVSTPEFKGICEQNPNFGAGPIGDITISSDRVWQYVREATDPTAVGPNFVTVP